jgi:hypothetical protein
VEAPELRRPPIVTYYTVGLRTRYGAHEKNIGEHHARQHFVSLTRTNRRSLLAFAHLLRQIIRNSHLTDGVQLRLQPIDMVLLVRENLFGELP